MELSFKQHMSFTLYKDGVVIAIKYKTEFGDIQEIFSL